MDSVAFLTVEQFEELFNSVSDPYPKSFPFEHLWSNEVAKAEPVLNAQEPHFPLSPWLDVDMSPYLGTEGMAASQTDGADGNGEVLTHDELPTESPVHMPNEAPEEMTVAERDCTFEHNSDEGSTLDVPSEAPADTRTESEVVVTLRTPTGHGKVAGQDGDYEFDPAINGDTPLGTLGEEDSLARGNTRQRSDSEARGEPITGPSGDRRAEAPSATLAEDEKATAQGLALATSYEAPSDPQHEAMCARQLATSESPSDPPAEKEKAAVAQEAVKPRLDDGPGIRAGGVEEGTDPGSPPVMLPDVDEMPRTEAAQAEHERCVAAFIYIITRHSENGEPTQDRDSATDKPSAAVLCNSDSPEDARDAEGSDETITAWRTQQTCRSSDQGTPERGSQDNPIIVDDEATLSSSKHAQERPRRPYRRPYSPSTRTFPTSDTNLTDTEDEWTASSNQSLVTLISGTTRKRKLKDMVAWGDPDFEDKAASELDLTWQEAQMQWLEMQSPTEQLASADAELVAGVTSFEETMIQTVQATIELGEIDPATASRLSGAWKELEGKLKGKGVAGRKNDRLRRFGQVLRQLEDCAGVLAVVQETPHAAESKHESEDGDYDTSRARRRVRVQR